MTFWLVIAYHVASRLAYVGWVGTALTRQRRRQEAEPTRNFADEYASFRRTATWVMNNDAFSIVLLCIATRNTLHMDVASTLRFGIGLLLVVIGLGVKLWAANTLGQKAYYWHNFFVRETHTAPWIARGPYRYLDNPMYTVGYLPVYGLALALGSLPGLVLAFFDQAAILTFHVLVERPHYRGLQVTAASTSRASPSSTR